MSGAETTPTPAADAVWIVSGPSSAGKSTLLAGPRAHELSGLDAEAPIVFPKQIAGPRSLSGGEYVHYNLLRPLERALRQSARRGESGRPAGRPRFASDPKWEAILGSSAPKRAIVLRADRETLLRRVGARTATEPGRLSAYDSSQWSSIYELVDVEELYAEWFAELDRHAIAWVEIDATDDAYSTLARSR